MASIVNARDTLLQAASTRLVPVILPPNVSVPKPQIYGITIGYTDAYWRLNSDGDEINTSITLTANVPAGLTGNVTWSKIGTGSTPPAAGTTNTWEIFAADQTEDTATYVATLVSGSITYTDTLTINRLRDGVTGDRGPAGTPGTITAYGSAFGISVSSWNSQLANRVIRNVLTGETLTSNLASTDHLLLGDTVTLSNGTNFAETRYWDGDASWVTPGVVIDGNLLVNGTASVAKLAAGSMVTGQGANARINIGDYTFVGGIKSPFHVSKVSPASNQALITALNDQDESVAIWGASAGVTNGNAVAGTWHDTTTEVNNTRWQKIGILASDLYGGAVAGVTYGNDRAGAFYYYDGTSNASPGTLKHAIGLSTDTHALLVAGPAELTGTASPLMANGSSGTAGQVLTSQGPGLTPTWAASGGGSVTYANVKTAIGAADTALTLPRNLQVTGLTVPTSGVGIELGYGNKGDGTNRGHVIAYNRGSGAYIPLMLSASAFTFADGVATFEYSPAAPTPSTSTNNTTIATTAYVVSRIAQDAPAKTGSGASGTWGISITGNAATATTASSASFATSAGSAPANGGNSSTVGGIRVVGGSGNIGTFSTGLSSIQGLSIICVDPYYAVVTGISGGTVTCICRDYNGNNGGAQGMRWMATGT